VTLEWCAYCWFSWPGGAFELYTMRLYTAPVTPTSSSMPGWHYAVRLVTGQTQSHGGHRRSVIKFHGWRQHTEPPASSPVFIQLTITITETDKFQKTNRWIKQKRWEIEAESQKLKYTQNSEVLLLLLLLLL